ncbi:hypothetical protein Taro_007922 [Colocasia esculenta]|uniref:non-specific serine/threonine protein kinase n=1 Tax=Colocasia esculenta TaxID=4460 RepID=A0A843TWU5_COLES|nr:hypothetical protein [Colocasia esculenta]
MSLQCSGFRVRMSTEGCALQSWLSNLSFGIKCGGRRSITASDTIVYEVDDQNLTTASYYVTDTTKWGVSSTGRFLDSRSPSYTRSVSNQFPNTLDTELFQTARLSPSSLRYYGLGLENGNYTIKLQFSETAYPDTATWQSVGRRVFDIYIQGVRREQDFDIRKTAGGSFLAVVRNYDALVTNNFLEIHFFWAGKGTCCIPNQGDYGPAVSAVSITPNFVPTVSNRPRSSASGKNNTGLVVGLAVGISVFCVFLLVLGFIWRQRRKRSSWQDDEELLGISSRADMFSYAELRTATEDFSPANKLGEGGFGPVFKGKLSDGRVVAVKQLLVASSQGKTQFVTEISTISAVQHKHLVKLYGCCVEGDKRLLVYEYLENKSLDQMLFGKHKRSLDWSTRFEICLGTARGLAYLHEESRVRIVHRDVKASNILLDTDLIPKISDFGLAKLYDDKKTHISTRVAGTIGYLAPEYAMRGHLTEKADVFGFGVVALEILSGRPNSDTTLPQEKVYLLEWAWQLHENNLELEIVDPTLSSYSKDEAVRMFGVALLCTQSAPSQRPSMSRVVAMLAGDIEVATVTSKPTYLTDWQFNDVTNTFTGTDYSSTSLPQTTGSSEAHMSSQPSSLLPSPRLTDPMLHEGITDGR